MMLQGELDIKKADVQAKAAAQKRAATSKQQPKNQHGTKSGPSKKKSSVQKDGIAADLYNQLSHDLHRINSNQINIGFIQQLFLATEEQIKSQFQTRIQESVISGSRGFNPTDRLPLRLRAITSVMIREFESDVNRLFREAS